MLKIEISFLSYCWENRLKPFDDESISKYVSYMLEKNQHEFISLMDDYESNFNLESPTNYFLVPEICANFVTPYPIFQLFQLSMIDDLSISERKKELKNMQAHVISRHTLGHLKRNDAIAIGLYINECLKAEMYQEAFINGSSIYLRKFKNEYIFNFVNEYIFIFSGGEIDPDKDFDRLKFGHFGFISTLLYFLYYLREDELVKAKSCLQDLKEEFPELFYLFAYGFTTIKINLSTNPSINAIKNFGKIDPQTNDEEYEASILDFIKFVKYTCSYCFHYSSNLSKVVKEITKENLNYYMDTLSIGEKFVAVAIMAVGTRNYGKLIRNDGLIFIDDVKRVLTFPNEELDEDDKEMLDTVSKFVSIKDENLTNILIGLSSNNMIEDLDFESGTFVVLDELFVFSEAFSTGLMTALKNNPNLFEEGNLDDLVLTTVDEGDLKDHES